MVGWLAGVYCAFRIRRVLKCSTSVFRDLGEGFIIPAHLFQKNCTSIRTEARHSRSPYKRWNNRRFVVERVSGCCGRRSQQKRIQIVSGKLRLSNLTGPKSLYIRPTFTALVLKPRPDKLSVHLQCLTRGLQHGISSPVSSSPHFVIFVVPCKVAASSAASLCTFVSHSQIFSSVSYSPQVRSPILTGTK